jgi:hypothetical protein
MLMRELQRIDFTVYIRALEMYFRNPVIALAPLAAGLLSIPFIRFGPTASGILGSLTLLLQLFALGVAIIAADFAWRYKKARMSQAWFEAKRKISDILLASLGFVFVMFLPSFFSGFLGPFVVLLQAAAFIFVIYALPAAAIGGVPGSVALQASVDRTRANPGTTIVLFIVCYVVYNSAPHMESSIDSMVGSVLPAAYALVIAALISAFTYAFALGYIALLLARVYYNTSYGRQP